MCASSTIIDSGCSDSDRKSTRLNSSHRCISYAVFCLKKKNKRVVRSTFRDEITNRNRITWQKIELQLAPPLPAACKSEREHHTTRELRQQESKDEQK